MTASNNQKRNQPGNHPQARSDVDIRDFDDVRGVISIAENGGDAIAYRGFAPPPSHSTGPRRLYGQILKAKCTGDAIGFDQISEGDLQARGQGSSQSPLQVVALDGRYGSSNSQAVGRQINECHGPPTAEMLAEYLSLPPNMQQMMKFLWAAGPPDALSVKGVTDTKNVPGDSR